MQPSELNGQLAPFGLLPLGAKVATHFVMGRVCTFVHDSSQVNTGGRHRADVGTHTHTCKPSQYEKSVVVDDNDDDEFCSLNFKIDFKC